jgi:branched-chain amino acid transport system permease protein
MLYREAGQFKATYAEDSQIFPIRQDKIGFWVLMLAFGVAVPLLTNEYWLKAILIPVLIFSLAAIGLNILTGYAGQLSSGRRPSWRWGPSPPTTSSCALRACPFWWRWCWPG